MALRSVASAIEYLRSVVVPLTRTDCVPIDQAIGRVLCTAIVSDIELPPADNSAMDGFAVSSVDIAERPDGWFEISQRIVAGKPAQPLAPGSVARIFTGGQIPVGADAVVIQEDVIAEDGRVKFTAPAVKGKHIRKRGQDLVGGIEIAAQGERLDATKVAQLAAAGVSEVPVYAPVRVALLSTGSELVEPGHPLLGGQIYNSNAYLLASILKSCGAEISAQLTVPDDRAATIQALESCAANADLLISCGGVSVGEEDHVKPAVQQLGKLDMWRLAIKPGKPLAFGRVHHSAFFGLPGNPVSVFVTFAILVKPFLLAMQGMPWPHYHQRFVRANFSMDANRSRQEYLRVKITLDEEGNEQLDAFPSQDSSLTSSMSWANALAILPIGQSVAVGDRLATISFEQILN